MCSSASLQHKKSSGSKDGTGPKCWPIQQRGAAVQEVKHGQVEACNNTRESGSRNYWQNQEREQQLLTFPKYTA